MHRSRSLLPLLLGLLSLACSASAPSGAAAPSSPPPRTSSAPAPEQTPVDPTASPLSVTRAWIRAVSSGDWAGLVAITPPEKRAKAEASLAEAPEAAKAERMRSLQKTAAKLKSALDAGEPKFVPVKAILAEPDHLEWYYCGEAPQGETWKSPCALSLIEIDGRFFVLGVTDYAE